MTQPDASIPQVEGISDLVPAGRGGFARVFKGWQGEMRRPVAVKVLDAVADDPQAERRFRHEVAAMGAVSDHPGVVPIYAAGTTVDGHRYLVMPFLPGGSLAERIRQGPLPPEEVASIGRKVAEGLAAAHAAGVLHRDVKPSNILFSAYGEPQLSDFGIARLADTTRTNATTVAATIAYAPPEILSGQPTGAWSDVYSLAATLHAALTGEPPFAARPDEVLAATVARAVTERPADLRTVGVPAALALAIDHALAKDPAERTPTALRFAEDLAAAGSREGETTTVVAPGVAVTAPLATDVLPPADLPAADVPVAGPPARRRRIGVLLAAAAAVVLLAAGVFAALTGGDDGPTRTTGATTAPPATSTTSPPTTETTTTITTATSTTTPTTAAPTTQVKKPTTTAPTTRPTTTAPTTKPPPTTKPTFKPKKHKP